MSSSRTSARRPDLRLEVRARSIRAIGHLFTPAEIAGLLQEAGFQVALRVAIDYGTGRRSSNPTCDYIALTIRCLERGDTMAWDPVWDEVYGSREWGKYPKEELVRFIARTYYGAADRRAVSVLDLGCGYGSATWYLAREGFDVHGIDGSAVVIEKLAARLAAEGLSADLRVGDILDLPYPADTFDCVVDLACLMCNDPEDTARAIAGVRDRLKPGGRLFSVTPSSTCWGVGLGEPVADWTFRDAPEGPFARMGIARFSPEAQVRALYAGFASLTLDHSSYTLGGGAHTIAHWIIEARKG